MEEFQDTTRSIGIEFAASHDLVEEACAITGCDGKYVNDGGATNYMHYCPPCYRQFRIELDSELNSLIDTNPGGDVEHNPDLETIMTSGATITSDATSSAATITSSTAVTSDSTSSTAVTTDSTSSTTATSDSTSSTAVISDSTSSTAVTSDSTSSTARTSKNVASSIPNKGPMNLNDITSTLVTLVRAKDTRHSANIIIGITLLSHCYTHLL
jgi:hypothetical protein